MQTQRPFLFQGKVVKSSHDVRFPQDQNVFDSKKKVKLTNAEGVEHKLSKKQLQAIEFNKALLAMYTNQVGETDLLQIKSMGVWLGKNGDAAVLCQRIRLFGLGT